MIVLATYTAPTEATPGRHLARARTLRLLARCEAAEVQHRCTPVSVDGGGTHYRHELLVSERVHLYLQKLPGARLEVNTM